MALARYYPELNDAKPIASIDARYCRGHWYLTCRAELKGRGVTFLRTLTADQLVPQARHKAGYHRVSRDGAGVQCDL